MWDDLAPNYGGGIYTQAFPNYFVIEFYNIVPCCASGDGDTWQVILFRNGNILMQYKELSNQGLQTDLTVGIQNDPSTGLQYYCEGSGNALANGRAILFSPPTFTCPAQVQNILGADTGFCASGSVTLNAGGTSIAQVWSTSATTSAISVSSAGAYSIQALDTNGCSVLDTIAVAAYTNPVVSLGPDVTECGSALLDAGNAGSTFLWNDNSTSQTLTVTASGSYIVTVTDPATSCSNNDTIVVTINPNPVVSLGADVTQCDGTVMLDAGNAGSNFMWNDNSTAQMLTVSATGNYYVTVTDPVTNCVGSDTISVTINASPVVNLGADITQCGGSVVLDAGNAGLNYLWNDNSTTQTLTASAPGEYIVVVTDPSTSCSGTDTVNVTINPNPSVTLAMSSTLVCSDDLPYALTGGSPAGGTYSGTGVSAGSFDPTAAGIGTHTITYTYTDANSCTATATENLTVDACTGVNELAMQGARIYPNPATGIVYIETAVSEFTIEVMNALGQVVMSKQVSGYAASVDLTSFDNGIYFIKLNSENNMRVEKVVLQR